MSTTEREQATYRCGHPKTPENTYSRVSDGAMWVRCLSCKRAANRRTNAIRREERAALRAARPKATAERGRPSRLICGHPRARNARLVVEMVGNELLSVLKCRECEAAPKSVPVRNVTPTRETMAFCSRCVEGECRHIDGCGAPVITPRETVAHMRSGVCACGSSWSVAWPSLYRQVSTFILGPIVKGF